MPRIRVRIVVTNRELTPTDLSNEKKFKICLDARNFKKDDLKVKYFGCCVAVIGKKQETGNPNNLVFTIIFKKFKVPEDVDKGRIVAKLSSDGFLVISAPRNVHEDTETDLDR